MVISRNLMHSPSNTAAAKREQSVDCGSSRYSILHLTHFEILPAYGEQSLDGFEQQARKWIDEAPKSKSAYIAYATLLYRHAFFVRGDGYAASVARRNGRCSGNISIRPIGSLRPARPLQSSDPHWYATMLHVATGEYWPEPKFDALLDEATAREPYYYELYFAALMRKTPNWGGSLDDVARL